MKPSFKKKTYGYRWDRLRPAFGWFSNDGLLKENFHKFTQKEIKDYTVDRCNRSYENNPECPIPVDDKMLDGVVETPAVFGDDRFEALERRVDHLCQSVELLRITSHRNHKVISKLSSKMNMQQNDVSQLQQDVLQSVFILQSQISSLKKAFRVRQKRQGMLSAVNLALSIIPLIGPVSAEAAKYLIDQYDSVVDFSDTVPVDTKLLGMPKNKVITLCETGRGYLKENSEELVESVFKKSLHFLANRSIAPESLILEWAKSSTPISTGRFEFDTYPNKVEKDDSSFSKKRSLFSEPKSESDFLSLLKQLVEEDNYQFKLQRPNNKEIIVTFINPNEVIATVSEIRQSLVGLIKAFKKDINTSDLKCRLLPNWSKDTLTIKSEQPTTSDRIVDLFKPCIQKYATKPNSFFQPVNSGNDKFNKSTVEVNCLIM